jgi:hypothetical protein
MAIPLTSIITGIIDTTELPTTITTTTTKKQNSKTCPSSSMCSGEEEDAEEQAQRQLPALKTVSCASHSMQSMGDSTLAVRGGSEQLTGERARRTMSTCRLIPGPCMSTCRLIPGPCTASL